MEGSVTKGLSIASLAFGLGLYILSIAGLLTQTPVSPVDPGLLSTTVVFVLLGVGGLYVDRTPA